MGFECVSRAKISRNLRPGYTLKTVNAHSNDHAARQRLGGSQKCTHVTDVNLAVAAATYRTNRSQCGAIARILADGTAEVRSGTSDMGPGTYTSMTQIAADALGMPLTRVRFVLGDSSFPAAPPHSGSRTIASVGSAVFTAANMLRDRLIRMAVTDPGSPLNGLRPEDVAVTEGRMIATDAPERGESYQDQLRRCGSGASMGVTTRAG